jgi:hypothetical protein
VIIDRTAKIGALFFNIGTPAHEEALDRDQARTDELRRSLAENVDLRKKLAVANAQIALDVDLRKKVVALKEVVSELVDQSVRVAERSKTAVEVAIAHLPAWARSRIQK